MARIDDGELYLEIEGADEDQLSSGLTAARSHIARNGIGIVRAMRSLVKLQAYVEQVALWEQGKAKHPKELGEDEWTEGEIAEDAIMAALHVAGFAQGHEAKIGLVDPSVEEPAPVVRDLFEPAE